MHVLRLWGCALKLFVRSRGCYIFMPFGNRLCCFSCFNSHMAINWNAICIKKKKRKRNSLLHLLLREITNDDSHSNYDFLYTCADCWKLKRDGLQMDNSQQMLHTSHVFCLDKTFRKSKKNKHVLRMKAHVVPATAFISHSLVLISQTMWSNKNWHQISKLLLI